MLKFFFDFFYYYFIIFIKLCTASICSVWCKFKLQKTKTVYLRIDFIPLLRPNCHYWALSEPNYFLQFASGYPIVLIRTNQPPLFNQFEFSRLEKILENHFLMEGSSTLTAAKETICFELKFPYFVYFWGISAQI